MALHGRSVGMVSSYSSSSSSSKRLCVVIQNPADVLSPTHTGSPSDLLMVHAVSDTHSERRWQIAVMLTVDSGCVAWPAYKPTPTTWTSELSQKLSAYASIYATQCKEQNNNKLQHLHEQHDSAYRTCQTLCTAILMFLVRILITNSYRMNTTAHVKQI